MINIKKLIAGFLVLAIGVSSFIFILSYYSTQKNKVTENIALNSNSNTVYKNAFANKNSVTSSLTTNDIINNPNNITGTVLSEALTNIINANPQGPIINANGTISATKPDETKMLSDLINSQSIQNISIPDWETEANNQKINLVSSSTDATIAYLQLFNNIYNENVNQTNIQNILNQTNNISQDSLLLVESSVNNALTETLQIPTPPIFADFQKSFIKMLIYANNSLQLATNQIDDPVKTSIILNSENSKYQLAVNNFNNQIQKLRLKNLSINETENAKTNNTFVFINNILGIKTANAQFAVHDIIGTIVNTLTSSGTWATVGQQALKYAETYALQVAENTLIAEMQNKVLSWINGSQNKGVPMFLTSWADTFVNAGTAAAIGALNSISPNVCPAFAPLISASFNMSGGSGGYGGSGIQQACTITADQMNNFAQDFSNGGFDMYVDLFKPDHNFYSTYFDTADAISTAAANAQNVAEIKAIANQGFTGTQVCSDGSNPNGNRTVCVNNLGIKIPPLKNGSCQPDETAVTIPNGGLCADGSEPKTTSPGQVTAQMSATALGAKANLIINAKDITGIIENLTDSLISGVINAGAKGLLSIGQTKVPPLIIPKAPPISCSPTGQTVEQSSTITFVAMGGAYDKNLNSPTYTWSAPGSTNPLSTGPVLNTQYPNPGKYKITVTASTDNSSAVCTLTVNPTSDYETPTTTENPFTTIPAQTSR
jgi:hypothetical protein